MPSSADNVSDIPVDEDILSPTTTTTTLTRDHSSYYPKRSFKNQPSKEEVDELCVNLSILATTPINTKIDTTGVLLNHEVSLYYIPIPLKRWWAGDSRDETIRKIERIVTKTILFCDVLNREVTRCQLKELLLKSVTGLNNIRETYSSCVQTSARIDTIISKIEEQRIFFERDSVESGHTI